MKLAMGCDDAAIEFKNTLKAFIQGLGHEVDDFGVNDKNEPILYPDVAVTVAQAVAEGKYDRAILICGTGIGMAISANKVPGIRAAVCHDLLSTQRSRRSNDAQIMCLGARVIAAELAKVLAEVWLGCEFDGGNSAKKVDRITYYEQKLTH